MSDGEGKGDQLPSDVAVLKSQMKSVNDFMGRIQTSLEGILASLQKYAVSDAFREQDRTRLSELAARLEQTYKELREDVTKISDRVNEAEIRERSRVERALRARLSAREKHDKDQRDEEAQTKAEWKKGAVKLLYRVLETLAIAAIAICAYHFWGIKLLE